MLDLSLVDLHLTDWLNLFLRWTHLLTGIAWIGSSFYFMWLDRSLTPPEGAKPDVEGELWMVHSGGFYLVERKHIGPGTMPKVLHWFKYEALFTWITGFLLLSVVYYLTGGAYLVDPAVLSLHPHTAVLVGVGTLILSWFVYDAIWQSPLAKDRGTWATAISLGLAAGVAVAFCKILSGRAAFIHFGAMFGTLMVTNVWVRILPAQQKMIDATKAGLQPDFTLSSKAKRRSVHNTYMTFPVLFLMLSNHYPLVYSNRYSWAVLLLLVILGMAIRHVMVAKGDTGRWAIAPAIAALIALVFLTATRTSPEAVSTDIGPQISFQQVRVVFENRCIPCHSAHPKIATFGPSPGGVHFDSPTTIHALKERIKYRVVVTKTMPLVNMTKITDDERILLGRWVDQGAPIDQ